MAEERIEILYQKDDCPCEKCKGVMFCEERDCADLTEWECQEKDIVYNRQEIIDRIAKVFVNLYIEIDGTGVTYTDKEVAEEVVNALLEVDK